MELFWTLSTRILPLLFLVAAGYGAGRWLRVDRTSIANLVIYFISPVVFFSSILGLEREGRVLWSPLVIFALCTAIATGVYRAVRSAGFLPAERSLLGFAAGDANNGYFGLPVALAIFGPDALGRVVLTGAGFILYENTVGYYLLARGKFGPGDALRRLSRLPAVYAIVSAVLLNACGVRLGGVALDFAGYFKGAYSVLGMMIVGLGLSEMKRFDFEARSMGILLVAKFGVWPAFAVAAIALDRAAGSFFPPQLHAIWLLVACCPLAANTVAFATVLDITPERAAFSVLVSTVVAVFLIPAVMTVGLPILIGGP